MKNSYGFIILLIVFTLEVTYILKGISFWTMALFLSPAVICGLYYVAKAYFFGEERSRYFCFVSTIISSAVAVNAYVYRQEIIGGNNLSHINFISGLLLLSSLVFIISFIGYMLNVFSTGSAYRT